LVAVGEPYADRDGVEDSGAVDLFGVGDDVKQLTTITQDSDGVIGDSEVGDMYGWAVAFGHLGGRPGDIDLAVGVPYENDDGTGRQVDSGKVDSGMVAVVFDVLTARGHYASVKWDLRQATSQVRESSGDRFGYALDYAEWNGDGYLAATAPLADGSAKDSGIVQLFARKGGGQVAPLRAVGPVSGWSLAWWDAGGVLSLAVGAPYEPSGSAKEAGAVRSFSATGAAGPVVRGDAAYEHLGASVTDLGGGATTPGPRLLAGAPDHGATGAAALLNGGRPVYYGPGTTGGGPGTTGGGPGTTDGGASVDVGAAAAG
jgi:hypothetical protein